ncbi:MULTISPECIES: ANTAR domain-containing response regulator [Methylobacterium]|jgi:response regulator NasT|uniref:Putative transcriptional regulatory protein pdtaR n=1 Tax=Methylobacterium bullatum TaxID=570505 RepID=A0A679K2G9_9HYPH|nr:MULTISPECIES: ANTAR domain-containing protein [Methylobacterium]KQO53309.1 two-component system response regulator [Methylobacterium sp. Leaf85]KQO56971.1 two-component system response regulator [Methylobacterium sp. Leaf86]KQO93647.1 two-component system response regulator [Methylobacterium sp. Leaf91]KQP39588.1 two-component system response regulator [Methylobacterium sp. Leaf106]MBD8900911.1 two-component system response regulator [Methylobacterium bullatum]
MTEPSFTVAVIDPSRARAAILEEGLRAAGIADVVIIPDTADLPAQVAALNPDVVVIHLESPSRDILEQMSGLSRHVERPVAMFVDRSDAPMMQAAVDAGISAYVVDGLHPQRIRSILDIAILRFQAFARLQRELVEARGELADRKIVERAKGILMAARSLSEEEAYKLMRRKAMNEKSKIADIARAIVTTADLFG